MLNETFSVIFKHRALSGLFWVILQHCVNYWSSTVLHHHMEKRFLTGNRASRLLPFEWPASVVILESNALQTVRYNAKIWKKEKKILAARLNASDALLLSKAPLKFKECSDGGYWLHKNAHTPCKKSSHLALPSQFESGMARKMRSFYGSLIFMIWCAYSISMPPFGEKFKL